MNLRVDFTTEGKCFTTSEFVKDKIMTKIAKMIAW